MHQRIVPGIKIIPLLHLTAFPAAESYCDPEFIGQKLYDLKNCHQLIFDAPIFHCSPYKNKNPSATTYWTPNWGWRDNKSAYSSVGARTINFYLPGSDLFCVAPSWLQLK